MKPAESTTQSQKLLRHLPELDGVRGLAILLVLVFHSMLLPDTYHNANRIIGYGRYGVDLFFVLSGFLITRILLNTKTNPRYFSSFYGRRAVRIFPLYYLYLGCFYLFVIKLRLVDFGGDKAASAAFDLRWTWLYLTNILIAIRGNFITASLNHFWTLAVEEHFYLAWPLVVYLSRERRLKWVCAAMFLGTSLLRFELQRRGVSSYAIDTFTLCRLDGFAIGAFLAISAIDAAPGKLYRLAPYALIVSVVTIAFAAPLAPLAVQPIMAVVAGSLLICATSDFGKRIFAVRWLRLIGKYSYAIYIFHFPIAIFLERKLPTADLATRLGSPVTAACLKLLAVAAISILVAFTSWHIFEKRFLAMKSYFNYRPIRSD